MINTEYINLTKELIAYCIEEVMHQIYTLAMEKFTQCISGELPWLAGYDIQRDDANECNSLCVSWYGREDITPSQCQDICSSFWRAV